MHRRREASAGEVASEPRCLVEPYPTVYSRLSEILQHVSDRLLDNYLLSDEIDASLGLDAHDAPQVSAKTGAGVDECGGELGGVGDHQVDVQRQLGDLADGLQHRQADRSRPRRW